jgi:hypothetical protein
MEIADGGTAAARHSSIPAPSPVVGKTSDAWQADDHDHSPRVLSDYFIKGGALRVSSSRSGRVFSDAM